MERTANLSLSHSREPSSTSVPPVTNRPKLEFYRKPSGYAVFAGHDASINLAKMSHDEDLLNAFWDKGETLSGEEKGTLEDWFQRFSQKYPVVGSVIRQ